MASRRPIVLSVVGNHEELPTGDTVPGDGIQVGTFSNQDIVTNLNTGNATFEGLIVPMLGSVDIPNALFTQITNQEFQCEFTGTLILLVSVHLQSTGTRNAMQTRVVRNPFTTPIPEGPIASSGYIRNNTGHNESSLYISHVANIVNGDRFGVGIRRESTNAGTATMAVLNSSTLQAMRLV